MGKLVKQSKKYERKLAKAKRELANIRIQSMLQSIADESEEESSYEDELEWANECLSGILAGARICKDECTGNRVIVFRNLNSAECPELFKRIADLIDPFGK